MTRPFRLTAPVPSEDAIHEAVSDALTLAIAPPGVSSADGVLWWTCEHRNARDATEGARRKRRGVVAGIPDVHVFSRGTPIMIELKRPGYTRSAVSDAQRERHAELQKAGVQTFIATSFEDVLRALRTMAVPIRGIS